MTSRSRTWRRRSRSSRPTSTATPRSCCVVASSGSRCSPASRFPASTPRSGWAVHARRRRRAQPGPASRSRPTWAPTSCSASALVTPRDMPDDVRGGESCAGPAALGGGRHHAVVRDHADPPRRTTRRRHERSRSRRPSSTSRRRSCATSREGRRYFENGVEAARGGDAAHRRHAAVAAPDDRRGARLTRPALEISARRRARAVPTGSFAPAGEARGVVRLPARRSRATAPGTSRRRRSSPGAATPSTSPTAAAPGYSLAPRGDFERPEQLVDDVRRFVRLARGASTRTRRSCSRRLLGRAPGDRVRARAPVRDRRPRARLPGAEGQGRPASRTRS